MRIHWRRSLSLICVLGAGSLSSCNSQKQPTSLSYEDARQNGSRPISPVTIASRLQPETAADFWPEMADTDGTNIPVANELHVVSDLYEIGAKATLLQDTLFITSAAFIQHRNVPGLGAALRRDSAITSKQK
jgi:hypothetical protein